MDVDASITRNYVKSAILIHYAKIRLVPGTKSSHPRIKHLKHAYVVSSQKNKTHFFPALPIAPLRFLELCIWLITTSYTLHVYPTGNITRYVSTSPFTRNHQGARRRPEAYAVLLRRRARSREHVLLGRDAKNEKYGVSTQI